MAILLSGCILIYQEDGRSVPPFCFVKSSRKRTGSAGIALFLHRLIKRGKPPFMLETETLMHKGVTEVSVA